MQVKDLISALNKLKATDNMDLVVRVYTSYGDLEEFAVEDIKIDDVQFVKHIFRDDKGNYIKAEFEERRAVVMLG